MTPSPTMSRRYKQIYWTAVIILTVSSVVAATLTLVIVRSSRSFDIYLTLAPLGLSLIIALLSVWASKLLIDEAQQRAMEQLEIAKLQSELEVTQRTRELHHDLVNHLSAVYSWIQLGAHDRALRYINKILMELHPNQSAAISQEAHSQILLLGMMGQKLSQAEQQGVSLSVQLDSEWGRVRISDDIAVRVLGNLVDNAITAASRHEGPGKGRVELSVAVEDETAVIRVWNNGPALPLPLLQRLEAPEREKPSPNQNRGLGLHIVRRLVDEAGGTMTVRSSSRTGTEFRVRFPLGHR